MTAGHTCDTSVLVPALISWHPDHEATRRALDGLRYLPGHVLLECYSVLTRLPAPHRISPTDAADVVSSLSVTAVGLPDGAYHALVADLGRARIGGGGVYDALIAATAHHHDLRLLTRDRRARTAYEHVGVEYVVL